MINEQKAWQIANESQFKSTYPYNRTSVFYGAKEAMQWKDRQLEPNLQYDPEHQVETFIADILPQRMKSE